MVLFSDKYGFTQPSDVIIRNDITSAIQNAICSCYDELQVRIGGYMGVNDSYIKLEEYIWRNLLDGRKNNYYNSHLERCLITTYMLSNKYAWFRKLNLIGATFDFFNSPLSDVELYIAEWFQENLNKEFARLNYAYRVIDGCVVEVNSKEEVEAIENALLIKNDSVRLHLKSSLEKLSEGDYRNSIKESASALEAFARDITGESTYSLKGLEKENIKVHKMILDAFDKLYYYTCDKEVGCRHSQMNVNSLFTPSSDEAVLMLVSFSSAINYLKKKMK